MGTMLYNGVELPDINEVWTDKATHPCACILLYDNTTYCLFLSTDRLCRMSSSLVGCKDGAIKGIQYRLNDNSWSFLINRDFGANSGASYAPVIWASYDFNYSSLYGDGSLILAASEPVDPNAPTDKLLEPTSGDGYALYNGVKLPNIDSVWTEEKKTTYPYAYVVLNISGGYFLKLFAQFGVRDTSYSGELIKVPNGKSVKNEYYASGDSGWSYGGYSESSGISISSTPVLKWASVDVLNSDDDSVYLAATSPIPLDGMNVIEWDGDTSGLAVHPSKANYYAAATGSVDATTAQAVLSDGTTSTDGYLSEGGNIYLYSDRTKHTSLLAYTEAPESPSGWTFNLQDFLNGLLCGLMSGRELKGKPTAYLYNGVQLPGLPEVEGFEYKVIQHYKDSTYILYLSKVKPSTRVIDDGVTSVIEAIGEQGDVKTYTSEGDSWKESFTVGYFYFYSESFIWANIDIVNGDISFVSTDPVPVYE